jgi:hypothetical protein
MHYEARFVIDTHGHITTLYKPKGKPKGFWSGLPAAPDEGEVEPYNNWNWSKSILINSDPFAAINS